MAATPFQSPACKTCKKRRIKCDLQKPKCYRCVKRGLECPGYDRIEPFVVFTPKRPYKAKALAKHRDSDNPTLPDAIASGPMFRIQLYSSFLDVYFPTSVDDAWHSVVTSWPTQPASTDLFQKSLTAWACISLGTSKCDQSLLLYGIRLYNQAIPIMSNMMRRDPYHDDIIYSLIIWTELESHYFPDGLYAWVAHWRAFKTLLKYQHQRPYPTNEAMRFIFNPFQKVITILAIMTDGISPEQHNEIMCSSETSSPLDDLLRFSASSAMLFNVLHTTPSTHDLCSSLLESCIKQRESMRTWYIWRQADIGEVFPCNADEETSNRDLPPTDDLFGPASQFVSLDSARIHMMFFNAMRLVHILIPQAIALVSSHAQDYVPDEDNFVLEGYYADQIARSIAFCLRDKNRACLTHLSILLLGQISQTYIKMQSSERIAWCQGLLTIISHLGFSSASHRKTIMLEEWNRAQMNGSQRRHTSQVVLAR
ncbi:unnamed protein product [Penicillium pancosmium]